MSSQSHAQSPDALTYFYLQNVRNGTFLTPKNSVNDQGTPVRLFQLDDTEIFGEIQLWAMTPEGLIVHKTSGLVLDVEGARTESARLVLWPAKEAGSNRLNQLWTRNSEGQIESRLPGGFVLAPQSEISHAFATLTPKQSPPSPGQTWRIMTSVLPQPSFFFVEHVRTRGLLTPSKGGLASGTGLAVEQDTVSYPEKQLWLWGGEGTIASYASSLVADVRDGRTEPGEVILFKAHEESAANQRWTYSPDGRIHSGLGPDWVLGMQSPASKQGFVKVERASTSADQLWRMRRAVYPEPISASRAVHLNGVSQAPSLSSAGPALADFTAEAWVRTSVGGPIITSRGTSTETTALVLGINADGVLVLRRASRRDTPDSFTASPCRATATSCCATAAPRSGPRGPPARRRAGRSCRETATSCSTTAPAPPCGPAGPAATAAPPSTCRTTATS